MQADMAPNSDSTSRYSQPRQLTGAHPVGERLHDVGLRGDGVRRDHLRPAQGHGTGHRLGALDLATHPSSSSSARSTCSYAASAARALPSPTSPGKRSRIAWHSAVERDLAGECRQGAEEGGVGQRAPEVLARDLGGRHGHHALGGESPDELREPELARTSDEVLTTEEAVGAQAGEQVDLVQQRRVLHDQRVGVGDGLPQPDRLGRRCGRRRPPVRRCAPSRRSGTPGRAGPRRRPPPRAARPR